MQSQNRWIAQLCEFTQGLQLKHFQLLQPWGNSCCRNLSMCQISSLPAPFKEKIKRSKLAHWFKDTVLNSSVFFIILENNTMAIVPSCQETGDTCWQKWRSARDKQERETVWRKGTGPAGHHSTELKAASIAVVFNICPFPVLSVCWALFSSCFLSQDACSFLTENMKKELQDVTSL